MKSSMILIAATAAVLFVSCGKDDPQSASDGVQAIDMGLSVDWGSCNLGASKPEEVGLYIAWGETDPKKEYTYDNYKWGVSEEKYGRPYAGATPDKGMTKYNTKDGLQTLLPEDDVVTVKLGKGWRMPTEEEVNELFNNDNCEYEETRMNGKPGFKVTSKKTGKSIFFPSGGYYTPTSDQLCGGTHYWTSSLTKDWLSYGRMYCMGGCGNDDRGSGLNIRPVKEKK